MNLAHTALMQIERRAPGEPQAITTAPDPVLEPKQEEGMRLTPDVVLFLGAIVLTLLLGAVLIPFLRRILREEDSARRAEGDRRGGGRP